MGRLVVAQTGSREGEASGAIEGQGRHTGIGYPSFRTIRVAPYDPLAVS